MYVYTHDIHTHKCTKLELSNFCQLVPLKYSGMHLRPEVKLETDKSEWFHTFHLTQNLNQCWSHESGCNHTLIQ